MIAVCLAQNSGFQSVCQFQYASVDDSAQVSQPASDISEKCDLTEKLLISAKVNLENIAIFTFVLALVIVAWLLVTSSVTPTFTEPIPSKYRRHLTFCVFRE